MSTRVVIGIPSGDMVHTDFALSLAAMMSHQKRQVQVSLFNARGCQLANNREKCVTTAQMMKADRLLFLDTDMVFGPDLLHRLLSHKKQIVAVNATRRLPPYDTIACYEDGKKIPPAIGLVKAGFVGAGAMLINMKVFQKMKSPYFQTLSDGGRFISEDTWFSMEARKAGIEIYCDTDAIVGHIGLTTHYIK